MADTFNYMSLADSASLQQKATDGKYTKAQMEEHAYKAVGAHMRTNPSKAGLETMLAIGERYCHVHGWGTYLLHSLRLDVMTFFQVCVGYSVYVVCL
jgi:hypothetical protein